MSESAGLDVGYIAKLARLNLTEEETTVFAQQLGDVLKYVAQLSEVDITQVEAATQAAPMCNVFREDEARDWFTTEEALRNAPQQREHLFIVPKVLE